MFQKYFAPSGPSSTEMVVASQCPPGLWTKREEPIKRAVATADPAMGETDAVQRGAPAAAKATDAAEYEQMHVRVIALENLVIALLATATDHQLDCAREMAAYIAPRPGATPHPLTLRAAAEMVSMVDRAVHFRTTPRSGTDGGTGS